MKTLFPHHLVRHSLLIRHYLTLFSLAFFMLLYTPAQGEMTISGTSNLDTLDYDLDSIHLKLEKLESRWQLSPTDGKLFVDRLSARRLTITMRSAAKKTGDSALPEQIKLPFPIEIQQAEVIEVVIITPTEQRVLNNVQFEIEADTKIIQLKRLSAGTPFGQLEAKLDLGTASPFALNGAVSIKQGALASNVVNPTLKIELEKTALEKTSLEKVPVEKTTIEKNSGLKISPEKLVKSPANTSPAMPYDIKVNLSGNLKQLRFESSLALVVEKNNFEKNNFENNGLEKNSLEKNDSEQQLALLQMEGKEADAIATIKAVGEIGLDGQYPLKLNTQIADFAPERLGNLPKGRLNLELNVEGNLAPEGQSSGLQVLLSANDSYLEIKNQREPLTVEGKMLFLNNQLKDIDFKANIATNSVVANGNLGVPNSLTDNSAEKTANDNLVSNNGLTWRIDLPDLTSFGGQFSGEAHANGTIAGAFENLAYGLNLSAQKLRLPNNIKLEKLDGKATLQAGAQGTADATFNATGLKVAQNPLINARFNLQGTRAAHQMKIQANEVESFAADTNNLLKFESSLAGGLDAGQWQGLIQSLSLQGETPVTLQAPAKLTLTSKDLALENVTLQLAKGRAVIDVLNAGSQGFISKGNISNFALEDIPPSLFQLPAHLQGNPIFSAQWDVKAVEAVNGRAIFKLDSGDLAVNSNAISANAGNKNNSSANNASLNNVMKPLGLQNLKAEINFNNNKTDFVLQMNGQQLGSLDLQINTVLTKVESGFALMQNAPLKISSTAQLNTLAWLPLSASLADASLDGTLSLSLNADGTVRQPNLRGNAIGKNLQFMLPSQGVAFTDGSVDAVFENDELRITQAAFKGGDGYLRTTGALKMQNNQPKVSLDWVAEQFTVISGIDRLLILNGAGKTTLDEGLFAISGDFKVAKGLLKLPDDDVPTLGDDVVVLGQQELVTDPALKILLSGLRIDLGDDFKLNGRGLDAQLTGAVTLTGLTQYHPHAEGTIRVAKGNYMAYGQILNITRGVISFNGALDNPGLNIRAMRNVNGDGASIITTNAETVNNTNEITGSNFSQTSSNNVQNVNAGVEITGSGLNPRIKLVSEPNVTDTEKLSWLVLGHGTESAGKSDFAMLSLAAGAVLSQGDSMPLQTKLARAAGLDELGFTGSDAETASLTFGKRLSSQLYLSYVKSVSGLLDVARLTYNLTPRWALQAETGSESAVDALYTFRFK